MIPKIKNVKPMKNYILFVTFYDGVNVLYDVKEDIQSIPSYRDLQTVNGLFKNVKIDESGTCVFWNDVIDLPSDTIYEYGRKL